MSTEICLPRVSPDDAAVTLVKWHVAVGSKVAPGDVIAEIESDKAVVELEAEEGGIVTEILVPEGSDDVAFQPGVFTPIAFHVWDGSNGETGLMMSISSWYNLVLPSKTPIAVYVYTFLAVVLSGLFELYLVRKVT